MKLTKTTLLGAVGALSIMATAATSFAVEPVKIRWASDHSGPPHPAAIAEAYFADVVEAKIPGSKVQIYWAKSLYKVPGAMEALSDGNLEMMTGQFGKGASVDPYVQVLVGAGKLTTPGAIMGLDSTKTYGVLKKRFNDMHDIKLFGSGHLSMYMGAGGVKKRMISPADFKGLKVRSMGPAENALLGGLGANPTTMAFGDVPSALQTGVIDGLLTSLGGFNATKEQAPYFSVAGINGIVGDYYFIAAGNKWWNKLKKDQQDALQDIIVNDFIPYQKAINFCNDKKMLDKYQVTDKSKAGIYVMTTAEAGALNTAENGATNKWIKTKVDDAGDKLVDQFVAEAKALVKANPLGSSALEKTDCTAFAKDFGKYKKAKKRL
ncbi:MAG: TRAP transporter substrate-binding protein [Candidatus Puniceispirillales bacterium]|jgi:TRAP-type C4-dicarboxylate transport system substrate-binding protein|tara:strand:+ start:4575 stop:5708 length:1134 start_codon:yes stop_codon:yes gene_type:complete